jgi:hypothetical protein
MRIFAQTRNPDVYPCCWIPGSREGARPGMTRSLNRCSEIFAQFRWNDAGHLMFSLYPTGEEATS